MKNKLSPKRIGMFIAGVILASVIIILGLLAVLSPKKDIKTASVANQSVGAQILAEGSVRSMNEAILHFQTGGKLTYLPFKEGDSVSAGQTIGSLDTYTIQKQLEASLNTYRVTRNAFDQANENSQYNILQGQQQNAINSSSAGVSGSTETNIINDTVKRIVDQNQANLDNSVIQVQLANYAFSLASIASPIDGVIIHEDVTTPFVNVTPQTAFQIADLNALVFRANVAEDEISYISEGSNAQIQLSGQKDHPITGTVTKVYPNKVTLPSGENVYQVDVSTDELASVAKYNQDGVVLFNNRYNQSVVLVPSWLVLSKQYIWVLQNNKPVFKKVVVGDTIGNKTQIMSGLNTRDKIILNPESVAATSYAVL